MHELHYVEDMHYLKPRWSRYIQTHFWEQISLSLLKKQKPAFYNDYQHRKDLISIHITLQLSISQTSKTLNKEIKLIDFHTYFQKRNKH